MSSKLLVFFCCFILSCGNEQTMPSTKMVYDFINAFMSKENKPSFKGVKYLAEREIETEAWNPMDYKDSKVLSGGDLKFMQEQIKNRSNFKLDQKNMVETTILSTSDVKGLENREDFFFNFRSKYKADEFGTISLPLFSLDSNKALVRVCIHSQFHDAGAVYVFAKNIDKWEVVEQLSHWP